MSRWPSVARAAVPALLAALLLGSLRGAVHAAGQRLTIAAVGAGDLRRWDDSVTHLARSGELRLRQVRQDKVAPGRSHERFDQYDKGVRVFGGDLTRQLRNALTVSVFGVLYTDINLDPTPALSANDARKTVARAAGAEPDPRRVPELVVLPLDRGGYALTYRVRVMTRDDLRVYFVDAHDGRVVLEYSDLQRQSAVGVGTGVFGDTKKVSARRSTGIFLAEDLLRPPDIVTFDMKGNVDRTLDFLGGLTDLGTTDTASSTDNRWTDGPDVDAHVYAGYTYDYYFKRFGLRGLDDHDLDTTVLVHPVLRRDLEVYPNSIIGLFFLNAFYAGGGVVVYGEGLPEGFVLLPFHQTVDYFAAGLDIVAHELSHGVTEFSSGLIYRNESGALNEAFSDIMAASAKFFFRPAGPGITQANYELGSDVIRPGGIRSFDDPAKFGDPDHYSKVRHGTEDNGGVHTNCTIVDQAFYLAIEGGTNRTSGLPVQGVGPANREQIEKVFYRAFTSLLPANATFSMARAATIQSARDVYGVGSTPERATTQSWAAVGVN